MPFNTFKIKTQLKKLDEAGIAVGDVVEVEWDVDKAYGPSPRSHVGVLKVLDRSTGWFEVEPSNRSPGHLRSNIASMETRFRKLEGEERARVLKTFKSKSGMTDSSVAVKSNPFIEKAKKRGTPNPFIAKARGDA